MSAAIAPDLLLAQRRRAALERALESRYERVNMKAALSLSLAAELAAAPPWWLMSMKTEYFVRCLPKYGHAKTLRLLRTLSISPNMTVGGMSPRQRSALVGELELRAGNVVHNNGGE